MKKIILLLFTLMLIGGCADLTTRHVLLKTTDSAAVTDSIMTYFLENRTSNVTKEKDGSYSFSVDSATFIIKLENNPSTITMTLTAIGLNKEDSAKFEGLLTGLLNKTAVSFEYLD